MIRRSILALAAAAVLVLAPTAAFGYGASDYTDKGSVSDTTPAVGQPFTVTVKGPASASVTLTVTSNPASISDSAITIAGVKALVKETNAAGDATFTVTLGEPGTYTLTVTDTVTGAVISSQVVVVAAAGALATTGSNSGALGIGAGAVLLVGVGLVALARRRRETPID